MTIREKAVLAEKAARAAGEMLLRHGSYKIMHKSENDYVTEMDFKSESLIREILLGACPEDQFFGEETGGATTAVGRWIVDPIDGTYNFMRGEKEYSISIAYEHDGELTIGCVFCPGTGELFLGVKGEGATCNGEPIHVAATDELRASLVHLGFGHRDPDLQARVLGILPRLFPSVSDVRRLGSAAFDLCCVASGRCDAFFEGGLHLYDYAAGVVILREAGGTFTGWADGEDGVATGNVLGSNGILHERLRAILNT